MFILNRKFRTKHKFNQFVLNIQSGMKCFSFCVIFVVSLKVEVFSEGFKNTALEKALLSIAKYLSQRNNFISIFASGSSEKSNSSKNLNFFKFTEEIPHLISSFNFYANELTLNSSAILCLDSVESLKRFNKITILPDTFSTSQQIFVYCGSQKKIAKRHNWLKSTISTSLSCVGYTKILRLTNIPTSMVADWISCSKMACLNFMHSKSITKTRK